MSDQQFQMVLKTTDYVVAQSMTEIDHLIKQGYEPHGSATFSPQGGEVRQPMVKREMISPDEYVEMAMVMFDVVNKLQKKMSESSNAIW